MGPGERGPGAGEDGGSNDHMSPSAGILDGTETFYYQGEEVGGTDERFRYFSTTANPNNPNRYLERWHTTMGSRQKFANCYWSYSHCDLP